MSENEIQLTAINPDLGTIVTVFDNSGEQIIHRKTLTGLPSSGYIVVTERGIHELNTGTSLYIYNGNGKFMGLSDVPNSTTPTYEIGGTYPYSQQAMFMFYLVSFEYEKATVEYGGQILAREDGTTVVTKGSPLRMTCEGLPMNSDVTITKIQGE